MTTDNFLVTERLDHIEYGLMGLVGYAHVVALRVQDELIDKIPLKTYGHPPVVLSKPLTIELVKIFLKHLETRSDEIANEIRELRSQLGKEGL